MHTDTTPPPEVRFEVAVAGSDYQKLLAHFRGRSTALPTPSKQVSALIDVDPTCTHFTVTRIGKHKLPKALSIKPGSDTYHNLAQAISTEVQQRLQSDQINPLLAKHLQQIIDLCPDVLPAPLHFSPDDLEVTDSPLSVSLMGHTQLSIPTLATLAPSVLLDIDDIPTLILPSEADPHQKDLLETLQRALERCPPLLIQVSGNLVELHHSILLPPLPEGMEIEFFVHWGSYEELAPSWSDEHIATIETSRATSQLPLYYRMHVPIQGWYGATLFARLKNGTEAVWLGTPGYRDARFRIAQDDSPSTIDYHQGKRQQASDAYKDLKAALTNPVDSLQFLERFPERHPELSLGGVLAQVISDGQIDEQSTLEGLSLPQHILSRIAPSYGIQELVFASPEGPHAAAGGLAQVISGLPKELTRLGIPVSIITPLFRYDNGNKHTAAESVLAHGVAIDSERVLPQYVATVAIPLGPTYHSGTSWAKRQPSTIECKVYLAQKGTIRIFFLTNSSVFDRLYQPVLVDEQLRRAIIFSRAVLETIACEQLMLRPSGIISNDWMTACVPAFAALDSRYTAVPWIRASKTIHMIHNGGADYHGRLPVNYNNEDLWPLFNLSSDHYFGFRDLHNGALLNLTAAASQHVTGGVVTVSQPYAQQLVAPGGGDGLEHILYPKRARVYGVSNGINRSDIDAWLSLRIGLCPLQQRQASHIVEAKERLRGQIQERFGLQINPEMRLLTFVGRLAEQKGLSLLSGFTGHAHRSTLEDILVSHPDTQILIAGPVTHGDREASALCETLHYLAQRYPGRVASALNYVSHSTALELIAASTLFLMPSRFEPGGITQLEALALGTPVVGRSVGGIKATIGNYEPACGTGTGFLCDDYTPTAFANTLHWALNICADKAQYEHIVQQALDAKHSWVDRAPTFAAVVQRLILGEARTRALPILNYQSHLADLATV